MYKFIIIKDKSSMSIRDHVAYIYKNNRFETKLFANYLIDLEDKISQFIEDNCILNYQIKSV